MIETPGETAARTEIERRIEATTRVTLRPIASPAALGFIGLAGATATLAGLQLGWVEKAEGQNVALILLAFTRSSWSLRSSASSAGTPSSPRAWES